MVINLPYSLFIFKAVKDAMQSFKKCAVVACIVIFFSQCAIL